MWQIPFATTCIMLTDTKYLHNENTPRLWRSVGQYEREGQIGYNRYYLCLSCNASHLTSLEPSLNGDVLYNQLLLLQRMGECLCLVVTSGVSWDWGTDLLSPSLAVSRVGYQYITQHVFSLVACYLFVLKLSYLVDDTPLVC